MMALTISPSCFFKMRIALPLDELLCFMTVSMSLSSSSPMSALSSSGPSACFSWPTPAKTSFGSTPAFGALSLAEDVSPAARALRAASASCLAWAACAAAIAWVLKAPPDWSFSCAWSCRFGASALASRYGHRQEDEFAPLQRRCSSRNQVRGRPLAATRQTGPVEVAAQGAGSSISKTPTHASDACD